VLAGLLGVGKEEILAYWTRQWQEFDPHVEPIEVIDREGGKTDVKVHQLVKSLGGERWSVDGDFSGLGKYATVSGPPARLVPSGR
jgi:hypothetical protein